VLTIRTAGQIRGAHNLRSFRSCAASTGVPGRCADARQVAQAEASLANSELRRRWLAGRWDAHQARVRRERVG
jgi:hypothetical protein